MKKWKPDMKALLQRLREQLTRLAPLASRLQTSLRRGLQKIKQKLPGKKSEVLEEFRDGEPTVPGTSISEDAGEGHQRFRYNVQPMIQWLKKFQHSNVVERAKKFKMSDLMNYRQEWRTILVLASAAASAHLFNALLANILTNNKPTKIPVLSTTGAPPVTKKTLISYNSIYDKFFFDHEGFIPNLESPGDRGKMDLNSAKPTTLPIELVGTIVLERDELSVASIKDSSANSIEAYQKNDAIGSHGATVWKVVYRKVYLLRQNGALEYLQMPEDANAINLQTRGAPKSAIDGIKQEDDNNYSISRKYLDSQLENIGDIVQQARAIPHFENGQIIGFRILNIKEGSVFKAIGLKENDVICEVNDIPLSNQGQALSLFGQLKDMAEGNITITLCGGGQNRTLTYNIR